MNGDDPWQRENEKRHWPKRSRGSSTVRLPPSPPVPAPAEKPQLEPVGSHYGGPRRHPAPPPWDPYAD